MKKNIFRSLLLIAVAVVALTSCLGNVGNKYTLSSLMATVVATSSNQVIVQIDATQAYYFADEFLGRELEIGERLLINKMTVNNDEQPVGATGSQTKPIKMIEVTLQKVETEEVMSSGENESTMPNDSVELFATPYLSTSAIGLSERTYITFSGSVLKKSDPKFRLVFKEHLADSNGQGKDTLCYEFKAANEKAGEKGSYEAFVQCFYMPSMKSEQIVKIAYYGKRFQAQDLLTNKKFAIIKAPKKTENQ